MFYSCSCHFSSRFLQIFLIGFDTIPPNSDFDFCHWESKKKKKILNLILPSKSCIWVEFLKSSPEKELSAAIKTQSGLFHHQSLTYQSLHSDMPLEIKMPRHTLSQATWTAKKHRR